MKIVFKNILTSSQECKYKEQFFCWYGFQASKTPGHRTINKRMHFSSAGFWYKPPAKFMLRRGKHDEDEEKGDW